jgi:Zn finger protein HypA/HybF involved in hydrogenase expression
MPGNESTIAQAAVVKKGVKSFPCKCDHCDWTGTVGEARIVKGKAQCPKCGGSLAGNRPVDKIMDALHECQSRRY